MAQTPEGKVSADILKHAKRVFIQHIRMVLAPGVPRGWPDILFLLPGGKPVFFEVKKPGGEPTQLQADKIKTLRGLRYNVHVVDNSDLGVAILDAYRAALRSGVEPDQLVADAIRACEVGGVGSSQLSAPGVRSPRRARPRRSVP